MFRRFVPKLRDSAVAAVLVGIAAAAVFFVPGSSSRFYLVTHFWCFVPLIWGLWALAAPKAWVPQRLPLWGAILGLILGVVLWLVLNLPARVLGQELSVAVRGVIVLVFGGFYYLLWVFVRMAYRSLAAPA